MVKGGLSKSRLLKSTSNLIAGDYKQTKMT
jgi:hypothetical protein